MIGWLIEALVASTVLMIAVLILRTPVRRAFGAQIAYALWLLPVLRLLLPPLPAAWWQAVAVAPVQRATEQMTILFVAPGIETAAPTLPLLGPALAGLWLAGAAAFIAWYALSHHHRFCRRLIDRAERAVRSRTASGSSRPKRPAARSPSASGGATSPSRAILPSATIRRSAISRWRMSLATTRAAI